MTSEAIIQFKNFTPPWNEILDNSPIPQRAKILVDPVISNEEIVDAVRQSLAIQAGYGAVISATIGPPNFLPFFFFQEGQKKGLSVCRISKQRDFEQFSEDVKKILQFEALGTEASFILSKDQLIEIFFMSPEAAEEVFRELAPGSKPSDALSVVTEAQFDRLFSKLVPVGTGFLVGSSYLLTNHHVIPDSDTAVKSVAQFDARMDEFGRILDSIDYQFDGSFIVSGRTDGSDPLDYSLVKLQRNSVDGTRGLASQNFSWIQLDQTIKIAPRLSAAELRDLSAFFGTDMEFFEDADFSGDPVSIIQHPKGSYKKAVVSSNRVQKLTDHFIRYEANADFGSSGAPVFNQNWDLVAIQHAAIGVLDDNGQLIMRKFSNGKVKIKVAAQQGVRVSTIVQDLVDKRNSSDELKSFLRDFVRLSNPIDGIPATPEKPSPSVDPGKWSPGESGLEQWSRSF
jgi:V8-like Glu-specific endopeptidase